MLRSLADELVEVVEDQEPDAGQAPQALLPAAVGAPSGERGEHAARLGEEHRVAAAAGQQTQPRDGQEEDLRFHLHRLHTSAPWAYRLAHGRRTLCGFTCGVRGETFACGWKQKARF